MIPKLGTLKTNGLVMNKNAFHRLSSLIARIWYPVALPEHVAEALGIKVSNFLSFKELIKILSQSPCSPKRLSRFMPRDAAELVFHHATCKEVFRHKTLVSYYLPEGWIEFVLCYDNEERLRRVYLNHKEIENESGVEIPLLCSNIVNRPKMFAAKV